MTTRYKPDDLVEIEDIADTISRNHTTVFNLARDHKLARYKMPAKSKRTFLR